MLIQHPQVEQRLYSEICRHFDTFDESEFTCSTLDELKYLNHILDEVLRLYPPVPVNFKRAIEDDFLPNGAFIEAGTEVQYNSWTLHRLKRLWGEDAEQFRPERWESEIKNSVGSTSGIHRFQYIPFHAGPRTCLGMQLALIEAKVLVVLVVKHFQFSLSPGFANKIHPKKCLTLQMENGLWVDAKPRQCDV